MRTVTGSELFSLLICIHTTTFLFLSIFSPLEMISLNVWETLPSWYAKCSLPVPVSVSKISHAHALNEECPFIVNSPLIVIVVVHFLQIKSATDASNFDDYPPDDETPPDDTSGWDRDF